MKIKKLYPKYYTNETGNHVTLRKDRGYSIQRDDGGNIACDSYNRDGVLLGTSYINKYSISRIVVS